MLIMESVNIVQRVLHHCHVLLIGDFVQSLASLRIQRKFKLLMLLFLTLATILAFWFALSIYGYTSNNAVNLFISLCLQVFFSFAPSPLFYEAAVEVTYPVPEGIYRFNVLF